MFEFILYKQDILKIITMSIQGLKSLRPGLLPDEENGKCSIVKYWVEFLSIDNHSPKRKRTRGGVSMRRHSQSQWKLEQNIITGVVIVGMVANALLCDRERSYGVLPEVVFTSYKFLDHWHNGRSTGRRGTTWWESQTQATWEIGVRQEAEFTKFPNIFLGALDRV